MHIVAMIIARTRDCVGGSLLRQPEYRSDDKFVFAAVNHRLNAFGFLSSKDLQEVDKDGLSGNKCMIASALSGRRQRGPPPSNTRGRSAKHHCKDRARQRAQSWRAAGGGDLEFGI
ncbi:BZ3500_MvSof-1268-A1-R1_C039g00062 [Microbotryum saponariae]|uniref:BZ3500_MvSof-1268-A1-R1_C039g00062 protein n=1 Tax=Microbotryum saponariae TaxID=289078 RepID=A0A2X0LAS5_9BASI|nr:BZ3500_MvSof-1268-A1-R1_C039g00062 [Microbotryum saponariae]